jgi:acyl-coenzyme A thioesterase PaaI-like protein
MGYENAIPSRLGIERDAFDDDLILGLVPGPITCDGGAVRISVLALIADIVGGWYADLHAGEDWIFTTDLSIVAPARPAPRRVSATGRALRIGKGTAMTEVAVVDETGRSFAHSQLGFVRMPRRPGDPDKPGKAQQRQQWTVQPSITEPVAVAAGCRVTDPASGRVEVELTDELRNPAGAMQGAMVALVGEVSAAALSAHLLGRPRVVTELHVRFLAMGRVGPIVAEAWPIGDPADGSVRVELRDTGSEGRLMTAVLARTDNAPGA